MDELEKYYQYLKGAGADVPDSYDSFKSTLQDPNSSQKYYQYLKDNKFDAPDTYESFSNTLGLKKKVGGNDLNNGANVSVPTVSQSQSQSQPNEEFGNQNPIDLAKQSDELSKQTVPVIGGNVGIGSGIVSQMPDAKSVGQSKKINQYLSNKGFDADKLNKLFSDFPDEYYNALGTNKDQLAQNLKDNPVKTEQQIASAKWQIPVQQNILTNQGQQGLSDFQNMRNAFADNNTDFATKRRLAPELLQTIRQNTPTEDMNKVQSNFANDAAQAYGTVQDNDPTLLKDQEQYPNLNLNQVRAFDYLKDVSPEKAQGYAAALIDPSKLAGDYDAQVGQQEKLKRLEEIGISLKENSINEKFAPIKQTYDYLSNLKNDGTITPQQDQQLQEVQSEGAPLYQQLQDLKNQSNNLLLKYPAAGVNDAGLFAQELLGQKHTGLNWLALQTGAATSDAANSIWDLVSEPFRSEQNSNIHQLSTLGSMKMGQGETNLTQENQLNQTFKPTVSKDLQDYIDNLKNNTSLTDKQKSDDLTIKLMQNPDQWQRTPIEGGKTNIGITSMLYGTGQLAATLAPYVLAETATGGGASASVLRKFTSSFASMLGTSFHDAYAQAIDNNEPDPYGYALRTTAINSAAMAGAGTPEAIRNMIKGTNGAAADLVGKMTDDEIMSALRSEPKSMSAFRKGINIAQNISEKVGSSALEGIKSAAKISPFLTGGQILNDVIDDNVKNPQDYAKQTAIEGLKFAVMGTTLGSASKLQATDMNKAALYQAGKYPESFLSALKQKEENGSISSEDATQVRNNITNAQEIFKKVPFVDDKGKPLGEKSRRDLLFLKMQENDINDNLNKDIPETLVKNLGNRLLDVKSKINDIYNGNLTESKETIPIKSNSTLNNETTKENEVPTPTETSSTPNEEVDNAGEKTAGENIEESKVESTPTTESNPSITSNEIEGNSALRDVKGGEGSGIDKKYLPKGGNSPEVKTYNIDTAKSLLSDLGVDASFSGYSDTNGVSVYFRDGNGKKIRVSDHGVTNRERMTNEVLLSFDTKTLGIGGKEGFRSYVEQNKKEVEALSKPTTNETKPTAVTKEDIQPEPETKNKNSESVENPPIPPEPPKAESENAEPESGDNKVGVSHKSLTDIAKKLGLKEPERGTYPKLSEIADRGRQLLEAGADPNEVTNPKQDLDERISIGRAHLEDLKIKMDEIARDEKLGIKSDEYAKAVKDFDNYAEKVKTLGTDAGRAMYSLQGERDLDTGSFSAVRQAYKKSNGEPSIEDTNKILDLTNRVKNLEDENDAINKKLIELTDKEVGKNEPKPEGGKFENKFHETAEKFRKKLKTKGFKFTDSNGKEYDIQKMGVSWNDIVELGAKAIEETGKIADGIAAVIDKIKDSDFYKGILDKDGFQKQLKEHYQSLIDSENNLEGLQTMFADKRPNDKNFTPEEAKALWGYSKKTYLEKGVPYKDMISMVGKDLGLSFDQVYEGINTTKTRPISNEMWNKNAELNREKRRVKDFVEKKNTNVIGKILEYPSKIVTGTAVYGHGGIFTGTHAGMTYTDLPRAKYTMKAFVNGYKLAYSKGDAYNERMMQQLKDRPNYVIAQRAGLQNIPGEVSNDEYARMQKFFKKVGGDAGVKGFNAIKILRQDLFDSHFRDLSPAEQQDMGALQSIAELVNNATGATNLNIKIRNKAGEVVVDPGKVLFAAEMESARWEKLLANPIKAANTGMRIIGDMVSGKKTVSAGDKVFARVWAKRVGWELATYAGLLTANSLFQNWLNPKNPVNIQHPEQGGYLRMKVGDNTIDMSSGMIGAIALVANLVHISRESQKELGGDSRLKKEAATLGYYGRGKLNPFYGTLGELALFKTDFAGNPLPFSKDKPKAGKHTLTWAEYAWEKAPIPIADAAKDIYDNMKDNGMSKPQIEKFWSWATLGHFGAALGEAGITGFHISDSHNRPTPFTDEDNKIPAFKYFLDKGMELPNTSPTSEKIKDYSTSTYKKLSDYPADVQQQYSDLHKQLLQKSLEKVERRNFVYISNFGNVSFTYPESSTDRYKRKSLDDMSKDELAKVLSAAQSEATEQTKQQMFYKKKK